MSAAENKAMMAQIYAELARGNSRPFVEGLADDVRWTITGKTKWSRTYEGKETVIKELLGPLRSQFAEPYRATAERIIAEGDCVVAEVRGYVTTKAGKPYNNRYCFVLRLAEGKVRELTEYLDTELVSAALGDPGT
jgi:uncharacterized protein